MIFREQFGTVYQNKFEVKRYVLKVDRKIEL